MTTLDAIIMGASTTDNSDTIVRIVNTIANSAQIIILAYIAGKFGTQEKRPRRRRPTPRVKDDE